MDERSSASSLVLSPKLVAEVEAAAADEQRPAQDIMRDAVMGYVKTRRWQKTLAYGRERASALGVSDDDVDRLIAEARQEQRPRG